MARTRIMGKSRGGGCNGRRRCGFERTFGVRFLCFSCGQAALSIFFVSLRALARQSNVSECSARLLATRLTPLAMTKGVRLNPASISPSLAEGAGGGSLRGLARSNQRAKNPQEKARAKLWRSHSTAPLLLSLILYCSLILSSQPQRARLCSRFNIDEALWLGG